MAGVLRLIVLGVLVASGIFLGFGGYAGDLLVNSGVNISKNVSSLSFVAEINNQTQTIATNFQNSQISTSVFAVPILIAQGVYDIIKLELTSISNILTLLVDGIFSLFPGIIPLWFRGLILAIVLVIIVYEVVSSVLKWNQ